jgi:hypothetical protein
MDKLNVVPIRRTQASSAAGGSAERGGMTFRALFG